MRTIELGGYIGLFDGDRLVAMAGQRLAPPGFREVSAVCTHPDFRGRGLAAGLTTLVARAILERGEQPFLHHASDNDNRFVEHDHGAEDDGAPNDTAIQQRFGAVWVGGCRVL